MINLISNPPDLRPTPTRLVVDQEEIGWVNFVLGRWTTKWLVVQNNYYSRLNVRKSSKRWVIAIIHKLLMITWNFWAYRNGFVHSPSGPLAMQEHHTLNLQIDAQWDQGCDDLFESDSTRSQIGPRRRPANFINDSLL